MATKEEVMKALDVYAEKYVKVENREVEVLIIQKGYRNNVRELMVEAIDLLRHQCE